LAVYCDRRMLHLFSSFWFKEQKKLRQALKDARRSAIPAAMAARRDANESIADSISVLRFTPESGVATKPPANGR
jgi:hypothetical protein